MKNATYLFLLFSFILFGIAFYYHSIQFDERLHERFMGFGTLVLTFLVLPNFLLWRYFKKQKEKENQDE